VASYYPESVVEEVVRQYRERDLPLGVIYLDIHYMNGYRAFTFDPSRFPDPKGLIERPGKQGVKTVVIVDPGVKYQPPGSSVGPMNAAKPELARQDQRYYVFDQGTERNYFQRRRNGQLFIPRVWPGDSVFVDFTLPDARGSWGDLRRAYTASFLTLHDILQLPLQTFTTAVGLGQAPERDFRKNRIMDLYRLYAADTWRVNPRLTFNYCIAWS